MFILKWVQTPLNRGKVPQRSRRQKWNSLWKSSHWILIHISQYIQRLFFLQRGNRSLLLWAFRDGWFTFVSCIIQQVCIFEQWNHTQDSKITTYIRVHGNWDIWGHRKYINSSLQDFHLLKRMSNRITDGT